MTLETIEDYKAEIEKLTAELAIVKRVAITFGFWAYNSDISIFSGELSDEEENEVDRIMRSQPSVMLEGADDRAIAWFKETVLNKRKE